MKTLKYPMILSVTALLTLASVASAGQAETRMNHSVDQFRAQMKRASTYQSKLQVWKGFRKFVGHELETLKANQELKKKDREQFRRVMFSLIRLDLNTSKVEEEGLTAVTCKNARQGFELDYGSIWKKPERLPAETEVVLELVQGLCTSKGHRA